MKRGKDVATIIVGGLAAPEGGKGTEMEQDEEQSEYEMMADELLESIKSGDSKMLAQGLKSFIETCLLDQDSEAAEEEEKAEY